MIITIALGFLAISSASRLSELSEEAKYLAAIVRNNEYDSDALEELNKALSWNRLKIDKGPLWFDGSLLLQDLGLSPSKYMVDVQANFYFSDGHMVCPVIYRSVQESPERSVLKPSDPAAGDTTFSVPDDVLKRMLRDLLADSFAVFKTFRLVSKRWRNLAYDAMGENLMDLSDDQYVHVAQGLLSANVRLRATQTLLRRWFKKLEQTPLGQPDADSQRKAKLISALITKHPLLDVWVDGAASSAAKKHLGPMSSDRCQLQHSYIWSRGMSSGSLSVLVSFGLWIGVILHVLIEKVLTGTDVSIPWLIVWVPMFLVTVLWMLILPGSLGGSQMARELREMGSDRPITYSVAGCVFFTYFVLYIFYRLTSPFVTTVRF